MGDKALSDCSRGLSAGGLASAGGSLSCGPPCADRGLHADLGRLAGINRPPVRLFWEQLRLLLINFILVNLWEETAWAGVVQTRLERRHNIFVAAALTAVPFGFIHLPLAFLNEITLASVLISLAAYILLGLFLRPLVGVVLRGSRDSLLAAGLMHSVFNRTNNDNGIAAALLNGEL